eukprot:3786457-Pleurochrysis_carterae.AAC.1
MGTDGQELLFELTLERDAADSSVLLVYARSATRQCVVAQTAHRSQQIVRAFEASVDLVRICERRNGIVRWIFASESFKTVLGHEPASIMGNISELSHLFRDVERLETLPRLAEEYRHKPYPDGGLIVEYPFKHAKGGRLMWFEHKMCPLPDNPDCVSIISRDISDRRKKQKLE